MTVKVKYWVACSGGVDSIVLVHLFSEMGLPFGILHCNFQLREDESNEDEKFVKSIADELNIPIRIKKFDTSYYKSEKRMNTQLAARQLRYQWFDEVYNETGAKICLGHHKDDQIETFLLQLRRGAKIKGLGAMPLHINNYVRPLLKYAKSDLIDLAVKNRWSWREDLSNRSNDYKRNLYRNEMLPKLGRESLSSIEELVYDFQDMRGCVDGFKLGTYNRFSALEFEIKEWKSYPLWLKQFIISENNLSKFPVSEIDKLCNSTNGASFRDDHYSVWRWKEKLVFYEEGKFQVEAKIDHVKSENLTFMKGMLYLDADKVKEGVYFADLDKELSFVPLGLKSEKTVMRFLKDKGVPKYIRKEIPVLVDGEGKLLGVYDLAIDDRFQISDETQDVYAVSFHLR